MQIDERRFYHSLLLLSGDWRSGRTRGNTHLSRSFFLKRGAEKRNSKQCSCKGKEFYFFQWFWDQRSLSAEQTLLTRGALSEQSDSVNGYVHGFKNKTKQKQKQNSVCSHFKVRNKLRLVSAFHPFATALGKRSDARIISLNEGSAYRWVHRLIFRNPGQRRMPLDPGCIQPVGSAFYKGVHF